MSKPQFFTFMIDSDIGLFRNMYSPHCLHHMLPCPRMCDNMRDRGHNFQLPTYCTALHKKSWSTPAQSGIQVWPPHRPGKGTRDTTERAINIIFPAMDYKLSLIMARVDTLEDRWEALTGRFFKRSVIPETSCLSLPTARQKRLTL